MKKTILTIAVLAISLVANGASINWTINGKGTAYGVNASAIDATSATDSTTAVLNSTVYLILASDLTGITGAATKQAFEDALADITIDSSASTSDGTKPDVTSLPVTSSLITTSSQTYGMLVVAQDSFGSAWYKVVTTEATGYAPGASADAQTIVTTSWTTMRNGSWTKGYTAVPEPSTAALALAGLALLLKRRKA